MNISPQPASGLKGQVSGHLALTDFHLNPSDYSHMTLL